jgi:hypothetical protein
MGMNPFTPAFTHLRFSTQHLAAIKQLFAYLTSGVTAFQ